jgi:hypothetical protein
MEDDGVNNLQHGHGEEWPEITVLCRAEGGDCPLFYDCLTKSNVSGP